MKYTKDEIEKLVNEFEKSSQSKADFGKGKGISVSSLNYLLRKNKQGQAPKGFKKIEVSIPASPTQILYPNGVRILLNGELSTQQLIAFLQC